MKSRYNDQLMMEKLAAGVAREIRNPLTSIKGFVQLLNKDVSKPEYYSMIDSEINEIETLVNRFITLTETQSVNFYSNEIRHTGTNDYEDE